MVNILSDRAFHADACSCEHLKNKDQIKAKQEKEKKKNGLFSMDHPVVFKAEIGPEVLYASDNPSSSSHIFWWYP